MGKLQTIIFVLALPLFLGYLYIVTLDYSKELSFFKVTAAPAPFDYFKLAQQWPPSICNSSAGQCPQYFTIHGLWPDNFTGSFLHDCSNQKFVPITNSTLLQSLNTDWPDIINHNNVGFWTYEWKKHGTCALHWYTQTAYFTLAVDLRKRYDLIHHLQQSGIRPGNNSYLVQNIVNAVKALTSRNPDLMCVVHTGKKRTLHEIRICFNSTIGSNNVIDCPAHHSSSTCSGNIYFPN